MSKMKALKGECSDEKFREIREIVENDSPQEETYTDKEVFQKALDILISLVRKEVGKL